MGFFWYTIFQITYAMCSTPAFTIFVVIFITNAFIDKCFKKVHQIFVFLYDSCCLSGNDILFFFSKLIIFMVCSQKDSLNFFIQYSLMYTSYLFSTLKLSILQKVNTQREHVHQNFLQNIFQIFFTSIYYFNIDSRYGKIIDDALADFLY